MSDMIDRQAAIKAADSIIERDTSGNNDVVKAMTAWKEYIKALPSAQPGCEDAVSRFKVLRLIDYSSHDLNDAVDNRYMQNEIKQLPSVTPKQRWIPCSERLPEPGEYYLVTRQYFGWNCTEYREIDIAKPCSHYNQLGHFSGCEAVPEKRYAVMEDPDYANSSGRPGWCPMKEVQE